MSKDTSSQSTQLKRTLGPVMIWGLGVGYVISGEYFGWNLGLPEGGPYGMMLAATLVTAMYVTFVMSYAELSCALPRAGGAFVYASRALGPNAGVLAGAAQIIEFVFAPPAIAAAIGAYLANRVNADPTAIAAVAYLVFTGINIVGVRISAAFELVITVLAVVELLIFAGLTLPHFSLEAFTRDPLPNGWGGAFAAIPFAIWFYLAIEGIANVAEESKNPQRDLSRGFGLAMATLVFLAFVTFFCAVGVDGWKAVVYEPGSTDMSDSPLPLAVKTLYGTGSIFSHLIVWLGLVGLIASFHGIILIAGRATFEFGRVGYAPRFLGHTLPQRKTPAAALLVNMVVGLAALLIGYTGEIITIAAFGALTLYAVSMAAVFALRRKEPELHRPFHAPLYPWFPAIALILSLICLTAMMIYNLRLGFIYLGLLGLAFAYFHLLVPKSARVRF